MRLSAVVGSGIVLLAFAGCSSDAAKQDVGKHDVDDVETSDPGSLLTPGGPLGPQASGAPGWLPGKPGSPSANSGSGFYDTTGLLASIRPAMRSTAISAAGVKSLDELPLYDISVDLDVAKATFELTEEVYFTNRETSSLDDLVLRVYANSSEGGAKAAGAPPLVTFKSGECVSASCDVKSESPSALAVKPAHAVAPGDRLRVKLVFSGRLDQIDSSRTNLFTQSLESLTVLGGGESSNFGLLAKGDDIASLANFYAVIARRRDGKWERTDDSTMGDLGSDDMANVHARIEVAEPVHVATSGVTAKEDVTGGKRVVDVQAAMVRDFAIIASEKLETSSVMVGDVTLRSHYLGVEKKAGERVLDVAKFALEDFEKRFGAYPYADLDVCEAALIGGVGGVEFAGLVTVASMFYRPALPTDGILGQLLTMLAPAMSGGGASPMTDLTDKMLEFTTAHEVAHQFWHGLVGSDSRAHPYLDESLAQFSAVQYLKDRYGDARAKNDASMNVAMNYKAMRMLGKPDAPVDRSVAAFGDMLSYAGLVYGKAPYLWLALRDELGEDTFFKAVQKYVADNRMKVAKPGALVDALAAADLSKEAKVRALAKRWLEEAHGDDDLGTSSLLDMIGPSMGLDPSTMDPKMKDMLDKLMKGMMGGSGGGAPDFEDLAKLFEILMEDPT